MSNNWISPSEIGKDIIGMSHPETGAEWTVGEWLNENENNLVIRYKTKDDVTHFLLKNEYLITPLNNPRANQIKCPVSMAANYFGGIENQTLYIDLTLIGIPGVVVERKDLTKIIDNIKDKTSTRVYEIVPASTVNAVTSAFTFLQSKAPDTISVAPKSNEEEINKCDKGELFNSKIVEINLKKEDPELPAPAPQETIMPTAPPTEESLLGGKRKSTKKRKSVKRKSIKKRKSAKKRKSVKK